MKLLIAFGAFLLSCQAQASPVDRWSSYIDEASGRFGVPEAWIRRVMRAESGGRLTRDGKPIVSSAGAMGLMQLMPGTWREMRAALGLGPDPFNPRDNILAGTAYLRAMYDRFGHPGLFAAYNAGPVRYAEHLSVGRPLPDETISYVRRIAGPAISLPTAAASERPLSALFAVRGLVRPEDPGASPAARRPAGDGLFAKLGQPQSPAN